ncbi:hypothetical protein BKP43_37810 [Variovorax boronicumulans]|nr:hypothetical protein BKP43_37810 [Variovorax boronicumulans]
MTMKRRVRNAQYPPPHLAIAIAAATGLAVAQPALGAEFDTGNPDLKLRWDNTVKYSAAARVQGRNPRLVGDINLDDGDRNFGEGLISSRTDVLSELELTYRNRFGARVSGATWYDSAYQRRNSHDAPWTANQTSVPFNVFPKGTRKLHGGTGEILDAFVFSNTEVLDMPLTVRLGRHTLLYGETLFLGANGIANAQAPVDAVKALSVPGSQFKEIILPVNQLSLQLQPRPNLAIGGYYQFEFRKSRIPGVGSYFSNTDLFDKGGENLLFAPGVMAPRAPDLRASNRGQFGMQVRWRPSGMDTEFGAYAVRYHDKIHQTYVRPLGLPAPGGLGAGFPLDYQLVYPEGIRSYGLSFSTSVGDFNVAGEASVRRNTPLVSGAELITTPGLVGGIGNNALYAVGNSAHLNLSAMYAFPRTALFDGGMLLGEVGWNRRTSITKNPQALDPNASRDALGFRVIFEPQWFQVLPQLDLSMPLSLGYNPRGKSSVVQQFNGGAHKGGDISVGLKGTFQQRWRFGLTYTRFFGSAGPIIGPDGSQTFRQTLADRSFVSLSIQTTF